MREESAFLISSNTILFGDHPQKNIFEQETEEINAFNEDVNQHWKLTYQPRVIENEEIKTDEPKVSAPAKPQKRQELIRNSTGSKIFQLLQNFKPNTAHRQPPKIEEPKAKDDVRPNKRKLQFQL
ncbi:hypothetical protein GPJ56_002680 [Histomonas meleagridis]|uniref:uncharacterized protein n=1 Tax=Histomonas meleagridis TaxID=135588 RepID=UPI003559FE24|nr:hypothetical protein GPJ56_002680 [Histomonas meleagridis]KAH0803030.1 hypothetical protein GO595_004123 [Histomonas meleagridis]